MKNRTLKILLIIETFIIVLAALLFFLLSADSERTELLREASPNGDYILLIQEMGKPDWPFGADHLRITLYENNDHHYRASFNASVSNDGMRATFKTEWLEDGVQIALMGSEQVTAYYILPFKTLEE